MATDRKIPREAEPTFVTMAAPASAVVGVASGSIVASNVDRGFLSLKNLGPQRVSLGFGAAAVLDKGISLAVDESWTFDRGEGTTQEVFAISIGAGATLTIQEGNL